MRMYLKSDRSSPTRVNRKWDKRTQKILRKKVKRKRKKHATNSIFLESNKKNLMKGIMTVPWDLLLISPQNSKIFLRKS